MPTVHVQLPALSPARYDVRIEEHLLPRLGHLLHGILPSPTAAIITDNNMGQLYLATAKNSLEAAGYRVISFVFPAGEQHKNMQTAGQALDKVLGEKIERSTPVIALGGGVVGDLAGFVAAVCLRGLPFVQVPTTLLAAVDASVGGKVGIDHPTGKNLIGAFHQPRAVFTDITLFQSLPERELRCGLAECIKHAVIRDGALFEFISVNGHGILHRNPALLGELVAWNVRIKAAIVQEDPYELGVRALLNLGHTFGHALETVMDYKTLQHGEAVALGMVAAAHLGVALKMLDEGARAKIVRLIRAVGLPVELPAMDTAAIVNAMGSDKKVRAGKLRFVIPTGIGHAQIVENPDGALVKAAIGSIIREPAV